MHMQRIILAHDSRLMREMLKRVIDKTDELKVVREVTQPGDLHSAMRETETEWVILSLPPGGVVPESIQSLVNTYPSVRFMTVAADGSEVKVRWLEPLSRDLTNLSLGDLISILRKEPAGPGF